MSDRLEKLGQGDVRGMYVNPHCIDLPVFDLRYYVGADKDQRSSAECMALCSALAECFKSNGALVIKDPRVDTTANERFINLMERYFSQGEEEKMRDVRPEIAYQVGATPSRVERPRCLMDEKIRDYATRLEESNRPTIPSEADCKWRFFWRIGDRPLESRFSELNAEPVIPAGFPEWREVMDQWGYLMLDAVSLVAEMLAKGFGLSADAFTQRMKFGPHLLAPTGTDLGKFGKLDAVLAGFHYDLNFLTIHGKSRYPGLHIWLRNGKRIPVRIPDGCLLIQAGKQMEWLTGGTVLAGYHEVICTRETLEAIEKAQREGRPTWRVSSTVFSQIASDELLRPLPQFETEDAILRYPPIPTGKQVQEELESINLKSS